MVLYRCSINVWPHTLAQPTSEPPPPLLLDIAHALTHLTSTVIKSTNSKFLKQRCIATGQSNLGTLLSHNLRAQTHRIQRKLHLTCCADSLSDDLHPRWTFLCPNDYCAQNLIVLGAASDGRWSFHVDKRTLVYGLSRANCRQGAACAFDPLCTLSLDRYNTFFHPSRLFKLLFISAGRSYKSYCKYPHRCVIQRTIKSPRRPNPARGHGELSNRRQRDNDDHSYAATAAPTTTASPRLHCRYIRSG